MMKFGVFLDGPLAGEFRRVEALPKINIPLPKRITVCNCDPEFESVTEDAPAGVFTYYRIAIGEQIAFYSKYEDDYEAIKWSIKTMLLSNINADVWVRNCRSLRAYE